MISRRIQPPRKLFIATVVNILVLCNQINGVAIDVTHMCHEVAGNANQANLQVRILINDDPVFKVYAFDASLGDTEELTGRTTDANCIKDTTGVTNTAQDPILYDITITTTDTSHDCGVDVTTESGITYLKFLFRVYAYSDTVLSNDDSSYMAWCRMDTLTGATLSTSQLDVSTTGNIYLQEQLFGAYLRLRDADDGFPVTVVKVGDRVVLSMEFYPDLELGPDNYGSHFFIGFLGVDPVSGSSASELYIIVYPRYNTKTEFTVSTKYGDEDYVISDDTPMKIILPSDLMGCSDDGIAEIEDKGVEINSYDIEIGILVCSTETDTADCYTALPNDVTGTEYITTSMPAENEYSEFMIISHSDGNSVVIDIPDDYQHIITENGTPSTAGGEVTVTLDKRMVFHLAQTASTASESNNNGYLIQSDAPVSIISGNRNVADDNTADQLLTTSKAGTEYVLIPVDLTEDNLLTTYIIQPVEAGDTVVTRYLSASTPETHTVTYRDFLQLDVDHDKPCELTADKAIIVTQVVTGPSNTVFGTSMTWTAPVTRWAPEYVHHHPDYTLTVLTVFKSEADKSAFLVNDQTIVPNSVPVLGPNGYVFGTKNTFGTGTYKLKLGDTQVISTFMVMAYLSNGSPSASNVGIATRLFGYRLSDKDECVKPGYRGDLINNDCETDGGIDEEIANGIDDDGDGLIDEDVRASTSEYSGVVAIRPVNCKVSPDPAFPGGTTNDITDADGCTIGGSSLFKPATEVVPQTGTNIGAGVQPKILYSGIFEVAKYVGEPRLFFKCDIEKYCTSSSDTLCLDICNSGGRKRRQVTTPNSANNITTDVWVYPYEKSKNDPAVTETVQVDSTFSACLDNGYIQMSFILLLLLMLLSFFTALCFCFLFRRKSKKEKEIERSIYLSTQNKLNWSRR